MLLGMALGPQRHGTHFPCRGYTHMPAVRVPGSTQVLQAGSTLHHRLHISPTILRRGSGRAGNMLQE